MSLQVISTTAKKDSLPIAVGSSMDHGLSHGFLQRTTDIHMVSGDRKDHWHIYGISWCCVNKYVLHCLRRHWGEICVFVFSDLCMTFLQRDLYVCLPLKLFKIRTLICLILFSKHLVRLKIKQMVQVEWLGPQKTDQFA